MPIPPQPDNDPTNFDPVRVNGVPKKYVPATSYVGVDPEGNEHTIAAINKNDWTRRPGHYIKAVTPPKATLKAEPGEPTAENPAGRRAPTTAQDDEADAVLTPLTTLRAEATALDIPWKPQWGLKRLTAAVEEAKAAKADAPADEEADADAETDE